MNIEWDGEGATARAIWETETYVAGKRTDNLTHSFGIGDFFEPGAW
ncbi:MAG: hypothetical protein LBU53_12520 [Zoogloeaceae bacterium]|nr:hypothetical protein [Zoogloeaceae bacterium]